MSLAGKILAVFNALAALGFLAVAGMDYSKRHEWTYSVFRHQLVVEGLPVDEADDTIRPGTPTVRDLTPKTLKTIFGPVSGKYPFPDPKTQKAELAELQRSVKQAVDGLPNDDAKRGRLAGLLLPLAKSAKERETLRGYIDPRSASRKPVEALLGELERQFGIDQQEPGKEGTPQASRLTLRQRIADLLYNISPNGDADPEWHARVLAVVGLDQYVAAADRQSQNLVAMVSRQQAGIVEEQASFVTQYQAVVSRLTLLDAKVRAAQVQLDEQKTLAQRHSELLKSRQGEAKKLNEQLQTATADAQKSLDQLAAEQKRLFDLQRQLAAALETSNKLVGEIGAKEKGR